MDFKKSSFTLYVVFSLIVRCIFFKKCNQSYQVLAFIIIWIDHYYASFEIKQIGISKLCLLLYRAPKIKVRPLRSVRSGMDDWYYNSLNEKPVDLKSKEVEFECYDRKHENDENICSSKRFEQVKEKYACSWTLPIDMTANKNAEVPYHI